MGQCLSTGRQVGQGRGQSQCILSNRLSSPGPDPTQKRHLPTAHSAHLHGLQLTHQRLGGLWNAGRRLLLPRLRLRTAPLQGESR